MRDLLGTSESPIATAILGATIIEFELETDLRARFRRKDDDTWKVLTGEIGPLSTFHQKIIAAYGFGIIDNVLMDGINTVRQIRNAFAHSKKLIDFNDELIVRELKRVSLPKGKRSTLYKRLSIVRAMKDGPRTSYVILCLILALHLLDKRRKQDKAKANRAQLNRRRKALADALRQTPSTGGTGLLGLLGRYPPVDPSQTILGSIAREDPHPKSTPPDTRGK